MKPWSQRSKIELVLVSRLRAWYWHFEVERMALRHLYGDTIYAVEAKMKDLLYLTIVSIIQFFVEADVLLRTPSETERNNNAGEQQ